MGDLRALQPGLEGGHESRDAINHQLTERQEPGVDVEFQDDAADGHRLRSFA